MNRIYKAETFVSLPSKLQGAKPVPKKIPISIFLKEVKCWQPAINSEDGEEMGTMVIVGTVQFRLEIEYEKFDKMMDEWALKMYN